MRMNETCNYFMCILTQKYAYVKLLGMTFFFSTHVKNDGFRTLLNFGYYHDFIYMTMSLRLKH